MRGEDVNQFGSTYLVPPRMACNQCARVDCTHSSLGS